MRNLRFPFPGSDELWDYANRAQAYQDLFVLAVLAGRRHGVFLDIGCGDPVNSNNTWLLESEFDWLGMCIDINDEFMQRYAWTRKCMAVCKNALDVPWSCALAGAPKVIDYLSLDIDPAPQSLACLKSLPLDKHRFKVITFEHDAYQSGDDVRDESRKVLSELGYILAVPDVAYTGLVYEDWWIDPPFCDERFMVRTGKPVEAIDYIFTSREGR